MSIQTRAIAKRAKTATFGNMCDLWFASKGRLATKTKDQYRNALEVWKRIFGADAVIAELSHGSVAAKVGSHEWTSPRLVDNYLICLRGVFRLASRELNIPDPMAGIENSKRQSVAPDPLTMVEMGRILEWMAQNCERCVWAYFEFAFLTGMRPEELIALKWDDLDLHMGCIRVLRARTAGEFKPLKTYQSRDVELMARAMGALEVMEPITRSGNAGFIFRNPVTGRPWHDERSQRDFYWKPALKALGIRYRRSYCTRSTYAATALLAGANPSYVARQMGHSNAMMLFTVYAKWIDGADRGRERAKIEAVLKALG